MEEKELLKNNIEYIRDWFLSHNEYIQNEPEEFFNLLVEFVVIYEKMEGINPKDVLIIENEHLKIVAGEAIDTDQALTDEEINKLSKYKNTEDGQRQFDVDHNENGGIYWW